MPVFRLIGGTKEKPGEPKIAARHKESYRFQDSANLRDEWLASLPNPSAGNELKNILAQVKQVIAGT